MKSLLLLILFTGAAITVKAQKKLLLNRYYISQISKGSISEFLQDLNQHSGIIIEYSSSNFEANKIVQLEGNETTVGTILQKVLEGQNLKLLERNNKIILVPSTEPFSLERSSPPQFSFFGYLKEEESNEPLINGTIYEPASQRGSVSNNHGYFNFLLPEGKHRIEISYSGLQPVILDLNIQRNLRKDISLSVKKTMHSDIVVEGENISRDGAVSSDQSFSGSLMSDSDPLQSSFLFPGSQNVSTSFSGFRVRGGGLDENLFLLDGNPVYNPTHLLGAISIINPTVLKNMRLYKSDFPARFSGSLSSVMDVYTREGNMNSWHGEANVGLLAGAFTLEGPLVRNKTALMVSARKNLSLPFYQSLQDGISSDFYDAHFKLTTILDLKNKIAFNFYKGEDRLRQGEKGIDNFQRWGNMIGSIGWNYVLGSRSFVRTSINLSDYQDLKVFQYTLFKVDDDDNEDQKVETKFINTYSSLRHYNAKSEAEIAAFKKIKFNVGLKVAETIIKPFSSQTTTQIKEDETSFTSAAPLQFEELSSYIETEMKPGRKLFVKPGLHVSAYRFKEYYPVVFQPRLFLAYRFLPSHRLYASYSKMSQFLHMVTNPFAGANKDIWVPSTQHIQPEESNIYNIGYSYRDHNWKFSIDGYYKQLMNVTNFAEGKSTFIDNNTWKQDVESGKGRGYGTEYMIEKNGTKLSWRLAYALAWNWRQFQSINNGNEFPYKYDQRHKANVGVSYSISPHLNISGLWSFATGNIYTAGGRVFTDTIQLSSGEDPLEDYQFTYHYSDTSQYREKPFQRYDFAVIYHSKKDKKLYSSLKAGFYNINGADEQYSYSLRGSLSSKSIQVKTGDQVFKLIPYISYSLRF